MLDDRRFYLKVSCIDDSLCGSYRLLFGEHDVSICLSILIIIEQILPFSNQIRRIYHDVDFHGVIPRLRVHIPIAHDDDLVVNGQKLQMTVSFLVFGLDRLCLVLRCVPKLVSSQEE